MARCHLKRFISSGIFVLLCYITLTKISNESGIRTNSKALLQKREVIEWPKLSPEILDYHKRLNLTNPGYMGAGITLPEIIPIDIQKKINESIDIYGFNEFLSTLIPLDREVPDVQNEYCKTVKYSENLPAASVISIFHNEPLTMILRTAVSILRQTPDHLLQEVILVDDGSTYENLQKPLTDFVTKYTKLKLLRAPVRLGLMKARMLGSLNAKGPVLIFMDAHVELSPGWIEPLLDPIAKNPNATTMPNIAILSRDTMEIKVSMEPDRFYITSFNWDMKFEWMRVWDFERRKQENMFEPIPSPTMLGAFFAIRKDFFELLGMYDRGFEVWGGENIETSFKVWMCGGKMLMTPCSHSGHLFRKHFPYEFNTDNLKRNTDRLAEVWLDDYKRFYHRFTKFNNRSFGDVSEQKKLRENLGCKPFQWYLDNVFPEYKIPEDIADPN